jgi:anaerobic selenocysteine-containing dehydrogenase
VTTASAAAVYVGVLLVNGLAVAGVVATLLGAVGMLGGGRARAHESACPTTPPPGAAARFAGDLRWGIPMVARFVAALVVPWIVRAEFRRATGGGPR